MTRAKDPELKALGVCIDALHPLDEDAMERVLTYLHERFGGEVPTYPAARTAKGTFKVSVPIGQLHVEAEDCDHPWHELDADHPNRERACPGCNAVFVGGP